MVDLQQLKDRFLKIIGEELWADQYRIRENQTGFGKIERQFNQMIAPFLYRKELDPRTIALVGIAAWNCSFLDPAGRLDVCRDLLAGYFEFSVDEIIQWGIDQLVIQMAEIEDRSPEDDPFIVHFNIIDHEGGIVTKILTVLEKRRVALQ